VPKGSESAGRLQLPQQRSLIEVVDERPLAIDLEHGQPFAVARLELGIAGDVDQVVLDAEPRKLVPRALTQPATRGGEEDDPRDRGRA
jgi:hypothetical protein